jgi:hypothetical protein
MQELLVSPAVQGAIVPFLAGLVVSAALLRLKLAGLSAVAGFAATVYLVGGFEFEPLTIVRKIVLLGLIAPVAGVVADFLCKPARATAPLLGLVAGAASVWVFLSLLKQKDLADAVLFGGGTIACVAWFVGSSLVLRGDSVRAGAAGFALGLGVGVAAILAASALLGLYAMALGTASSAFLLVQMLTGRKTFAGVTYTLTVGLLAGLLGAAALYLAQLPWYALAVMALVPLAARMPVPAKWPVWGQTVALCACALSVAAVSCFLVWESSRGPSG